jgi:hypothetical protein
MKTIALAASMILVSGHPRTTHADVVPPVAAPDLRILGPEPRAHLGGSASADLFSDLNRSTPLTVGDFNGDGIQDIAIGAPDARNGAGVVYVVYGRPNLPGEIDLATGADVTILGASSGDRLGFSVAAGDVRGNGRTDLIIGAPGADSPSQSSTGAVFVLEGSGMLGGVIDLRTEGSVSTIIYGSSSADRFGAAIATGDAGGPTAAGHPIIDILVGAPGSGLGDGAAFLFFGGPTINGDPDVILRGQTGQKLGTSVAIADINGDGAGDIFAGAPEASRPARTSDGIIPLQGTGAVFGMFGPFARGEVTMSGQGFSFYGVSTGDRLGASLAAGDVTGDGVSDLVVGAPGANGIWRDPISSVIYHLDLNGGALYVLAGSVLLTERRLDAIQGDQSTTYLSLGTAYIGFSIAVGKYNINQNLGATPDVLLSRPIGPGVVIDLFGGQTLLSVSTRPRLFNNPAGTPEEAGVGDPLLRFTSAHFGFAMAAGDINGDGAGDIVVSAPYANNRNGQESGVVDIWFGVRPPAAAGPSVDSLRPVSGPTNGGTNLTVLGTNFIPGATVTLGGVPATEVIVASPTILTAITGAHGPGAVDVVVKNPDGQSSTVRGGFVYTGPPPPVIVGAAIAGKDLVVTGQNFDAGVVLVLDGIDQRTIDRDAGTLVGKKVGKGIRPGQSVILQARNSDGSVSAMFEFNRP